MPVPDWSRYPQVSENQQGCLWLSLLDNLGRSPATIDAYARGLDQYLSFCTAVGIPAEAATLAQVSIRTVSAWGGGSPSFRSPASKQCHAASAFVRHSPVV